MLTQPFVGELKTVTTCTERADRPAERVTLVRPRARITYPRAGATIRAGEPATSFGGRPVGTGPVTNVDISLTGESE